MKLTKKLKYAHCSCNKWNCEKLLLIVYCTWEVFAWIIWAIIAFGIFSIENSLKNELKGINERNIDPYFESCENLLGEYKSLLANIEKLNREIPHLTALESKYFYVELQFDKAKNFFISQKNMLQKNLEAKKPNIIKCSMTAIEKLNYQRKSFEKIYLPSFKIHYLIPTFITIYFGWQGRNLNEIVLAPVVFVLFIMNGLLIFLPMAITYQISKNLIEETFTKINIAINDFV